MRTPNFFVPVAVFPEYVTPETNALVAVASVLIRSAWSLWEGIGLCHIPASERSHDALIDNRVPGYNDFRNSCATGNGSLPYPIAAHARVWGLMKREAHD